MSLETAKPILKTTLKAFVENINDTDVTSDEAIDAFVDAVHAYVTSALVNVASVSGVTTGLVASGPGVGSLE